MTTRLGGRLPHRRVQTVLAIAALATAVALPVVLLSVGGGVFAHEIARLQESGYQLDVTASGDHGVDGAHDLSERIDGIPNVAWASPILSSSVELYTAAGASPALAEGVIPNAFAATLDPTTAPLFPHPLPLGDPTDLLHYANGTYDGPSSGRILVSTPIATADDLSLGDVVRLSGDANLSDAMAFTVAGTFGISGPDLGPTAVFGLILPLSDLQLVVGVAHGPGGAPLDAADTLEVALTPATAPEPGAVAAVMRDIASLVPYYTVTSVNDEAAQLASTQQVLTGFYLGLSAVGLIVGLGFLALLLLREVEAERRTIGIRRALGVPDRAIFGGLLLRGYSLAAAGTLAGTTLGILVVQAMARYGSGDVAEVAQLATFAPLTLGALALSVVALSGVASAIAARSVLRRPIPELLR